MKAYELMKLAAENPQKYKGKKYSVKWGKVVDRDGDCMKAIEVDSDGQLVGACGKWAYVSCDTELEEIKPEPVPFMDAVRAYSEGKTIRCEYGENGCYNVRVKNSKSSFPEHGYWLETHYEKSDTGINLSTGMVLNGAWYIED
jgi:hypothetical protein